MKRQGFTLVEIMIVVAIIGLLAAIAIPSFMRARTTSQQNACVNNLRMIEDGKERYAMEMGLTNGAVIAAGTDVARFAVLVNTNSPDQSYIRQFPLCPASTTIQSTVRTADLAANDYTVNTIGTRAVCRIVAGTHVMK
jgi:prepilin-type N-terminal cleavage/methylation domain-containing protein